LARNGVPDLPMSDFYDVRCTPRLGKQSRRMCSWGLSEMVSEFAFIAYANFQHLQCTLMAGYIAQVESDN
jgi:hypothetical protein